MIPELFELKGLAQESRQILFAVRKACSRGEIPLFLRNRFKSRLLLLKSRCSAVNKAVALARSLTQAQQALARRELGGIRSACRDVDKLLFGGVTYRPKKPRADGPGASRVPQPGLEEQVQVTPIEPPPPGLCPVCGETPGDGETISCPGCNVVHHRECWDYVGGCAIYGCSRSKPW